MLIGFLLFSTPAGPASERLPNSSTARLLSKTGRRVSFEYGLFGGENDSVEHAEELADLIKGIKCHVNLIPVNYVPERDYVRTPRDQIFEFEKTLKKRGINVTIRREQGSDIDAACGQLRAKERKEETR